MCFQIFSRLVEQNASKTPFSPQNAMPLDSAKIPLDSLFLKSKGWEKTDTGIHVFTAWKAVAIPADLAASEQFTVFIFL